MCESVSIYKDKEGKFIAQLIIGKYENGNYRYKRFKAKTKKEALKKANEYQLQSIGKVTDENNFFLEDYLRNYFNDVKSISLKKASLTREHVTIEKHIIPYIGHHKMKDLNADIIQKFINSLAKQYSYSTVHKAYVTLNSALKLAIKKEIIIKNPCEAVIQPTKNQFERSEPRFFNDEEIKLFINEAKNPKYLNGIAISSLIYTGLRVGELCALSWKDIDFSNRIIYIKKNMSTYYDETTEGERKRITEVQHSTKTSDGRCVYLCDEAIELLKEHKERCEDKSDNNFVIMAKKIPSVDVLSNSYKIIARNAGIKNSKGIHTLRHTFGSLLTRNNNDIKIVSQLLGHKSTAFTNDIYIHLINEQEVKAIEGLKINK